MAWPIVTITIKLLWLKFLKGAAFGIARYFHRLFSSQPRNGDGKPMEGKDRWNHVLRKETTRHENVIFLIMMLGNFFFGLQEMILWLWGFAARRLYDQYTMGMPAMLIDADVFCSQYGGKTWRETLPALGKWLAMASLVYWPRMSPPGPTLTSTRNSKWVEARYGRQTFMIRTNKPRTVQLRNLHIVVDDTGLVSVTVPRDGRPYTASTRVPTAKGSGAGR